jgi:hypothetical protein
MYFLGMEGVTSGECGNPMSEKPHLCVKTEI